MTIKINKENIETCPVEGLLKMLAGKWKPQIFRLAADGSIRFSYLLRQLEGSSKQSISIALKELEEEGILERKIIKQKPLHVEYNLSSKGKSLVPVFQQMESLLS